MNTGAAAARRFGARFCMPVAGFFLICQIPIPATAQEAHATAHEAVAAGEAGAEGTRFSLATFRCTNLAELVSCGAALNMKPNDPDLLIAEADVLAQLKRPGEAIGVYRNSLRRGASPDVVNPKIAVTQSQRHSFLVVCETQVGEVAESACESAWLPGAPDEGAVFKRRGLLLQSDDQLSAALDAYMAAARLGPRDRKVARAVVSLSASIDRKDAIDVDGSRRRADDFGPILRKRRLPCARRCSWRPISPRPRRSCALRSVPCRRRAEIQRPRSPLRR